MTIFCGSCDQLQCIGGNDDYNSDVCVLKSGVSFFAEQGTQYYILVHGYGGSIGSFALQARGDPDLMCNDGIQNGDEEGVDCGGSCGQPCCTPCDGIFGAGVTMSRVGTFGICRERCLTSPEFWESLGWECGSCE
jgi:hypothetical protein